MNKVFPLFFVIFCFAVMGLVLSVGTASAKPPFPVPPPGGGRDSGVLCTAGFTSAAICYLNAIVGNADPSILLSRAHSNLVISGIMEHVISNLVLSHREGTVRDLVV